MDLLTYVYMGYWDISDIGYIWMDLFTYLYMGYLGYWLHILYGIYWISGILSLYGLTIGGIQHSTTRHNTTQHNTTQRAHMRTHMYTHTYTHTHAHALKAGQE